MMFVDSGWSVWKIPAVNYYFLKSVLSCQLFEVFINKGRLSENPTFVSGLSLS